MDWKIIILFLIVTFNSYSQTIEDKELITFLYHNAEKIDIEDEDFADILSEWDFRNLYLSKMIKIDIMEKNEAILEMLVSNGQK